MSSENALDRTFVEGKGGRKKSIETKTTQPDSGERERQGKDDVSALEVHEGGLPTPRIECAFDHNDPSVQTYFNENLGVAFLALADENDPDAQKNAAEYRNQMQRELQPRLGLLAKIRPETGNIVGRLSPGEVIESSRNIAAIALDTSARFATDVVRTRAAAEKRIAWLEGDTEAMKKAERVTIPPSIGAVVVDSMLRTEEIYGIPLAVPGETQTIPNISWEMPSTPWLDTETPRTMRDELHALVFEANNPAELLTNLKKWKEKPEFKKLGMDARLAMTEEAAQNIPGSFRGFEAEQIREALALLHEPEIPAHEMETIETILTQTEDMKNDASLAKSGKLTKKGVEQLKQLRAFSDLSSTQSRVVLYDRLMRRGVLSREGATTFLTQKKLVIAAEGGEDMLSAVIVRANGAVLDLSDKLTGKSTQNTEEVQGEVITVQTSERKLFSEIHLSSGDTILLGGKNNGETIADSPSVQMTAIQTEASTAQFLAALKEDGIKGMVIRVK